MNGESSAVRYGEGNIQNCFLKTVQKSSESVQSEESAGGILRGKKRLRYLFCIARVDANLSFSRN